MNTNLQIPGVTLLVGPKPWQILQRSAEGTAEIQLSGTFYAIDESATVQVRLVNENSQSPVSVHLDWQDADMSVQSGAFSHTLRAVPAGGLYRVETRIRRPMALDSRAIRGDCIHHIGVGDIYVIAGQSNASGTGKGATEDGPQLGVHLFGNDEQWRLATHPLEDSTNTLHPITITGIFHGHSPWIAFGKRIHRQTGIPIGLIPAALGGSPISRWTTSQGRNSDLLENMFDMIEKAGGSFAGVLWYQGESDANRDAIDAYESRFRDLIEEIRERSDNPSLPVITAQLNRLKHKDADTACWSRLREIQRRASLEMENVYLIVTIDASLSDEIHNDAASNVKIGERFADAALEHLYEIPTIYRHPSPKHPIYCGSDRMAIIMTFEHLSGDWTPMRDIFDFTVEDSKGFVEILDVKIDPSRAIRITLARPTVGATVLHGLYGADPAITLTDDSGKCIVPFSVAVQSEQGC